MANVNVFGGIKDRRGRIIPVHNSATTEATLDEVKTDSSLVGSEQSIGTYGDQLGNYVCVSGGVAMETDSTYNYVRSAGVIKGAFAQGSARDGGCSPLPAPVPYPFRLASGDQLMVMVNAVTDREASLTVACSNGEYHVFSVTPTGASDDHEFVSVLTGNGIGETLTGRTVTHWYAYAGNNDAELTSQVNVVNGSGVPIGCIGFTNSGGSTACVFTASGGVPIALNSRAIFSTDA
tara:strand:- start:290 stop:994 length:705 start_codon:yes stop_codon:yes gene_type:complete